MKCKSWSNKINNFVVRRLKSIKINGQQQQQPACTATAGATTITAGAAVAAAGSSPSQSQIQTCGTMPAMPKEKASAVSLSESNFSELKLKEASQASAGAASSNTTNANNTNNNSSCRNQQAMATTTNMTWGSSNSSGGGSSATVQMARNTASTCGCGAASVTSEDYMPFNRHRNYANGVSSPLAEALATATASGQLIATSLQRHAHTNSHSDNRALLNGSGGVDSCRHCCGCDSASNSQSSSGCQYTRATPAAPSAAVPSAALNAAGVQVAAAAAIAPTPPRRSPNDFIFGRYIGEGSFSNVYLAVDVNSRREYAIKVCDKLHILREHKQEYIRREREVMHLMTNVPGFVSLSCTFQDNRSLYFVMTYAKNGDLLPYINKVGSFDVACTRHYAAELVLACEQMHRRNVVHRDLKPENILLDEDMHTLIADFGSAKMLSADEIAKVSSVNTNSHDGTGTSDNSSRLAHQSHRGRNAYHRYRHMTAYADEDDEDGEEQEEGDEVEGGTGSVVGPDRHGKDVIEDTGSDDIDSPSRQTHYQRRRRGSFVGTAQYVSPEVLQNGAITPAADLWALGCIVYQMISGLPPFRGSNDYVIFREILACKLDFPQGFDDDAEDLVRQLLRIEPERRLGAQDAAGCYESIRAHPFFASVDFASVRECMPPPIYPYLPGVSKDDHFHAAHYCDLEPGLDDRQLTRLLGMELGTALGGTAGGVTLVQLNGYGCGNSGGSGGASSDGGREIEKKTAIKNKYDLSEAEKKRRLEQQINDKWTFFADNEVILKRGYVNKRKGLFARKRMLLLTTGPRLIYIDPVQMIKKGEIPWSPDLRVEAKNFKIFFVHTPNRTYYLEDPEGYSLEWVDAIDRMHKLTYRSQQTLLAPPKQSGETVTTATAATITPIAKIQKSCATSFSSSSSSSSSTSSSSSSSSSSALSSAPTSASSSPSVITTITTAATATPATMSTTAAFMNCPVAQTSLTTATIRTASR